MNIKAILDIVDKEGIIFLTYGGVFSQTIITGLTEVLERETTNDNLEIGKAANLFTIFIELSQNMMNYSKVMVDGVEKNSEGLILVGKTKTSETAYYVMSFNTINKTSVQKLESRLNELEHLDKEEIKKRYKELRKSGEFAHDKGGGIGFYEIAKRSDKIEHQIMPSNSSDIFYFKFTSYISF